MALKFYNSYINSLSKEPVNEWADLMQAGIDDTWNDTSTLKRVQGQTMPGMRTYACESVQVNSVLDPKTGTSLGDNFRKIIYRNLKDSEINDDLTATKRWLGKYYKFDNYTWLTINTNTTIGALSTAVLEKCNNMLRWYDKDKNLHIFPCVFERVLSGTNFDWGSQGAAEIGADTLIKVQLNEETNAIPYNQRFIFDGHAFQVKQINNHISKTYLELYLFEIVTQSNDDLENNIANSKGQITDDTNETRVLPEMNNILHGDIVDFSIFNYINGVETADKFAVSASGPIENVNYRLTIIDDNHFSIENLQPSNEILTVYCEDLEDSSKSISVEMILGGEW